MKIEIKGVAEPVDVPDGLSPDQIKAYLDSLYRKPPVQQPVATPQYPEPPFTARVGRGMMDVAQGAKQIGLQIGETAGLIDPLTAQRYSQKVGKEISRYEKGAGQKVDWGRILGQIAGTAPLGGIPAGKAALTRAGLGALAGGAGGGVLATGEGDSRVANAILGATGGAAGGVALGALGNALGTIGDKGRQVLRLMSPAGRRRVGEALSEALEGRTVQPGMMDTLLADAHEQLRKTGRIDAAALQRKADMQAFGLQPTSGQVTRDPGQWADERNLSKLTFGDERNPLSLRFAEQNQQLKDVGRQFADAAGNAGEDAVTAAERAQRVAGIKARVSQRVVGKAYGEARAAIGADSPMPVELLQQKFQTMLGDQWGVYLPRGVQMELEKFATGKTPFTPKNADSFIKYVNRIVDPRGDRATQTSLGLVKQIVTETLEEYGEASSEVAAKMFGEARALARDRFKAIRPKLVAKLLEPDYAPDDYVRKIVQGKGVDVQKMVSFFESGNKREKELGRQVLDGLRRQIDEVFYEKATGRAGEAFNGASYAKAVNDFGKAKMRAIFGEEGAAKRMQFARAAKATTTQPYGAAVNTSNTAPTLMSYMSRVSARVPFVGGMADIASGLARAGREYAEEAASKQQIYDALTGGFITPEALAQRQMLQQAIGRRLSPATPAIGILGTQLGQ